MNLVLFTVSGWIRHCWVVLTVYVPSHPIVADEDAESPGRRIPYLKIWPKNKYMFQISIMWFVINL
jgi:hypothetical protein